VLWQTGAVGTESNSAGASRLITAAAFPAQPQARKLFVTLSVTSEQLQSRSDGRRAHAYGDNLREL
jgi:hypothetical protein